MLNIKKIELKKIEAQYKDGYFEECLKQNKGLFTYCSAMIAIFSLMAIFIGIFSEKGISFLKTPECFVYFSCAVLNSVYYVLFMSKDISERKIAKVSFEAFAQTSYISLLLLYAVISSVISMNSDYPKAILYSVVICYIGIGLSHKLFVVYLLIWLSFILYTFAAVLFVGDSQMAFVYLLNSFYVNVIISILSAVYNNHKIDTFMQKIYICKQQSELQCVNDKLSAMNKQFKEITNLDSLTEIFNRRAFDEKINLEWAKGKKHAAPLSLLMIDIDFFKKYNDLYGHQQGDVCLKRVAKELERCLKGTNGAVFRYGGEEFAVVLPDTDIDVAESIARKVVSAIENLMIPHAQGVTEYVTISAGARSIKPSPAQSCEVLILEADKALYTAKQSGRNRYEVY